MAEKDKDKGKKGGGASKIIIILLAAILVSGIGFGAYYILVISKQTETHVVENPYKDRVTYSLGDAFVLNLADKDTKYISVKIDVVYKTNTKLDEELKTKNAILRDRVVTIIRTKTEDELNRDTNLANLKKQIMESINPVLEEGKIEEVVVEDYKTGK